MHPKDRLLKRRCFSRPSNEIWLECHVSVDFKATVKAKMKKLHASSGFETSVVVVSPLEYIQKQKVENVEKEEFGITAASIGESVEVDREIETGNVDIVYAMIC